MNLVRLCFVSLLAIFVSQLISSPASVLPIERELEQQWAWPPAAYGPSCFWWWFGGTYSAGDIRDSLDAMKAAGLGGFQIFPVYSMNAHGQPGGVHDVPYLAPEFLQLVRQAVQYGSQIGMVPESLLGTGWPFGGPHIPPEMGAGRLKLYSREVGGPQTFSGSIPGEANPPEKLLALQAAQVNAAGEIVLDTLLDLTARVNRWRIASWQVPAGRWLLMTFVSGYTGMKVKRASPGGEGLVLDHFDGEALKLHLKHNGDLQAPYLQGALSVMMDSWEVFDSNWTGSLPAEFQRRRRYSLWPYLPAIFLPSGETGSRVRYDFRHTISELALDNFFTPFRDWAHQKGFKTRVEAHGTPADVLEAYGINDYPQAESYGEQDKRRINVRDRKLASSAAHLFGRRQVSCESFTWLRFPLFVATLENMKAAADAIYLDGINQINYHGVPLSPSGVESPGWYYYASTLVGRGNTWWPYLRYLSDYLRRANYLLQQGEPVSDVAVYLPVEDVWSHAFGGWYDLAGSLEGHLSQGGTSGTIEMLTALQDGGFDFDFINAGQAQQAHVDGSYLCAGPMRYRVLVLPELETVEPAALERMRDFCRAGGTVIATGRLPDRSPGLLNAEVQNARIRALSREIFGDGIESDSQPRWRNETRAFGNSCGKGDGIFIPKDPAQALAPGTHLLPRILAQIIPPDAVLEPPDRQIGFVHRRTAGRDIYFIANISDRSKRFHARFRASGTFPWRFDAESGTLEPFYQFRRESESIQVALSLRPWDSTFVVFSPSVIAPVTATNVARILKVANDGAEVVGEVDGNGDFFARTVTNTLSAAVRDLPAALALAGPWQLSIEGQPTKILEDLVTWTRFTEATGFSGTASYRSEFLLPEVYVRPQTRLQLDLGEVQDIAEVLLNGTKAGVAWKHPYTLDIGVFVKAGRNQLEVKVTNRLINRMLLEPALPPPYPNLRDRIEQPIPSGLLGPVWLRPARVITLVPKPNTYP